MLFKTNIRLISRNAVDCGHENWLLETTDPVEKEAVELFIEGFLDEHSNTIYTTQDVMNYVLEYTGGRAKKVKFEPDVVMAI